MGDFQCENALKDIKFEGFLGVLQGKMTKKSRLRRFYRYFAAVARRRREKIGVLGPLTWDFTRENWSKIAFFFAQK